MAVSQDTFSEYGVALSFLGISHRWLSRQVLLATAFQFFDAFGSFDPKLFLSHHML